MRTLFVLALLLDGDAVIILDALTKKSFTTATGQLSEFLLRQLTEVSIFERNGRWGALNDAFNLEVP